jgi:hypothetical protein
VPTLSAVHVAAQRQVYVPVWNVKSTGKVVDSYTIIRAKPRVNWIQVAEVRIVFFFFLA